MSLTETQEQILDAVMSCIIRDGIEGTSLRNVAKEADVSLGLLSYHFDDKQSLVVAAFQHACDRLLEVSLEALADAGPSPELRLSAFIRGAFQPEFLAPDYLARRFSLWAISRSDTEVAEVERSLYMRYAEQLAMLIAATHLGLSAGQVSDRATDVIVTQNGLWLNWSRHQDEGDLERGLRRCEAIALTSEDQSN